MGKCLVIALSCSLLACSYVRQVADPDVASVSLIASSATVPADGSSTVQLSVTVTLDDGKSAQDLEVNFRSSLPDSAIVDATAHADAQGRAVAQVSSTQAGATTFVAWITFPGGTVLASDGVVVTFTPATPQSPTQPPVDSGPPDAAHSTLVVNPNRAAAGVAASISVHVADGNDAAVSGQAVSFAASGSSTTWSATVGVTDANGNFSVEAWSTLPQTQTITAYVGAFNLTAPFTVVVGAPSLATSTFVAAPNRVVANGSSQSVLTLDLRDSYSNAVSGVAVTFSSQNSADTLAPLTAMTDANGRVTTSVRSTRAGSDSVTGTFAGSALNASVTFVGGLATKILAAATPNALTQGTYTSVVVTVADAYGNPSSLFSGTVSLTVSDTTATLGVAAHSFASGDGAMYTFAHVAMFPQTGNKIITAATNPAVSASSVTLPVSTLYRSRAAWQSSVGVGDCLGVANANNVVGTSLSTLPCSFRSNQIFDVGGDNTLRVMGLCVAPQSASFVAGTAATLALCDGSAQQQWSYTNASLQSLANPSFCLDAGSVTGGTVVVTSCSDSLGQEWRAREVGAQSIITATLKNWVLDVAGDNMDTGTVIDATTYNTSSAQLFAMTPERTLRVGGQGASGPFCIEVAGNNMVSGQSLDLAACGNGIEQMWSQQGTTLRPYANPNLCVDVNSTLGATVVVNTCNAGASQVFAIQPSSLAYNYVEVSNPNLCWAFAGLQGDNNNVVSSTCDGGMLQAVAEGLTVNNSLMLTYPHGTYYFDAGSAPSSGTVIYTTNGDPSHNGWHPIISGDSWIYQYALNAIYDIESSGVSSGGALVMGTGALNTGHAPVYRWPVALQMSLQAAPSQCFATAAAPVVGSPVKLVACSNELGDHFVWQPGGSMQFGGLCLDFASELPTAGEPLQLAQCDYSDRQSWNCGVDLTQPLRIFNKQTSSLCLDGNGSTTLGALLTVQSCAATTTPATQTFIMH